MNKVAVMMRENQPDGTISGHFGKAEWVMAADTQNPEFVFLKNEATNGRSVAELLLAQHCTDVIFTQIGAGALGHLTEGNLRGWIAPANISGRQAIELFQQQKLQPATAPTEAHSGGCCCHHHGAGSHGGCHR